MKTLSEQVDYHLDSERTQKCNQIKERDFDINDLFENKKPKSESLAEINEHRIELYSVENDVNREQRRAFLMRLRITRSLFIVFAISVLLFIIGITVSIIGAFHLQNNNVDGNVPNIFVDLSPNSSKITSYEANLNSTLKNEKLINLYVGISESTQKYENGLSDNYINSTTINTNDDSIDGHLLEELAPDYETNNIINGLMDRMVVKRPNEYRIEDLPSTLISVVTYFSNFFNISRRETFTPKEHFDYLD